MPEIFISNKNTKDETGNYYCCDKIWPEEILIFI